MKRILFSVLLVGAIITAQAEEQRCDKVARANVHDSRVLLALDGQSAKDIFNAMPSSSELTPRARCYTDTRIKVKGGFVCTYNPNSTNPPCAYHCELEVSTKTGKASERKINDMCSDGDP